MRDGFHAQSPGGQVGLRDDGSPVLDYPLTDFVMDGARRALLTWPRSSSPPVRGRCRPVHEMAPPYASLGGGA